MTVRIICDSTADLDDGFRRNHGVHVVPLKVIIGKEEYLDGVDIQPADLYRRLRKENITARTSQPTPAEFESVFRAATDDGSAVVCTTISAELSGTYASATQAATALPDRSVHVIDTRSVSVGHYAVTWAAVRAAAAGGDASAVVAAARRVAEAVRLLFTVETLEYLRRGGRIGGAQALLGSMLDIKPLLEMRDGRIEAAARVRTYHRAIEACAEAVEHAAEEWGGARILVGNADSDVAADTLVRRFATSVPDGLIGSVDVGPVIGAHAGPGAIGVAFFPRSAAA
jgi:DegV family protein with EDD domain